jgi:hypothetical protein
LKSLIIQVNKWLWISEQTIGVNVAHKFYIRHIIGGDVRSGASCTLVVQQRQVSIQVQWVVVCGTNIGLRAVFGHAYTSPFVISASHWFANGNLKARCYISAVVL